MNYAKKGMSNLVATILIILLTVVAVVLITNFIIPMVNKNLAETECFKYRDYFSFEVEYGYNCYNLTENDYRLYAVSVRAGSLGGDSLDKIEGFDLVFMEKIGTSSVVHVVDGEATDDELRMLNENLANLEIPGPHEVRTYVYKSSANFTRVNVYLKLESDTCDKSDSIDLEDRQCFGERIL